MDSSTLQMAEKIFLDFVDGNPSLSEANYESLACKSVEVASAFYAAVVKMAELPQSLPAALKMKGCKACFGSGGKVGQPCKVCGGAGKVLSK